MGEIRFSKTASATSKSVSRYSTAFLNTLLVSEDKKSEPANLSPSFELIQSLVDEKCENGDPSDTQFEPLLAHFEQLRLVYEMNGEEESDV